jgi:hypothetical protein
MTQDSQLLIQSRSFALSVATLINFIPDTIQGRVIAQQWHSPRAAQRCAGSNPTATLIDINPFAFKQPLILLISLKPLSPLNPLNPLKTLVFSPNATTICCGSAS